MQIISDVQTVWLSGPTFLTIGNFDGIHRGHQALLRQMCAIADRSVTNGARPQTALLTFDPHPLTVLRPEEPLQLLTTPRERLALAGRLGVDLGIVQPFTSAIAALSPRQFMLLLKQHTGLARLVVGPDFALGRNRSGTLDVLTTLGEELNYALTIIEPVDWQGRAVRSRNIRQLLGQGEVAEAADLLGRPYHVTGVVEQGDKRGRQIGVPTANLHIAPDKLLPAYGVYATYTRLHRVDSEQIYRSVTNLGVRPTVDGHHLRLETHLLDFPENGESDDLYGRTLTVEFVERLRGEQRFSGLDELVAQIHADIAAARQVLE